MGLFYTELLKRTFNKAFDGVQVAPEDLRLAVKKAEMDYEYELPDIEVKIDHTFEKQISRMNRDLIILCGMQKKLKESPNNLGSFIVFRAKGLL